MDHCRRHVLRRGLWTARKARCVHACEHVCRLDQPTYQCGHSHILRDNTSCDASRVVFGQFISLKNNSFTRKERSSLDWFKFAAVMHHPRGGPHSPRVNRDVHRISLVSCLPTCMSFVAVARITTHTSCFRRHSSDAEAKLTLTRCR